MAQYTKVELLGHMTEWVDEFWSGKDSDPVLSEMWRSYMGDFVVKFDDTIPLDTDVVRQMGIKPLAKIGLNTIDRLHIPFSHSAGLMILVISSYYGNPGIMNMYLAAFKHESVATLGHPMPELGNFDWVNSVTGGVWYTKEFLHKMWDKQKLPDGSNLVDRMGPDDFLLTADEAATIKE